MGVATKILALLYIVIGLYLLNSPFKLVTLDFLGNYANWILFVGGVIVIIHGILFLSKRTKRGLENF